ncbi:MAG TPA: hypothetical protein VGB91_04790 [Rhizomicrobium sp.]
MAPAKIVILRHGEKKDAFALCSTGVERSLALTAKYLGKGAAQSLFGAQEAPAAFFAVTLHTIELASPSAQSWNAPLIAYSAVPIDNSPFGDSETVLNARTQQAAADVMGGAWAGKTVVMVWEHKHIASKKLEAAYPDQKVTLRQLLNLDTLGSQVPDKWEGENYDYFWIVTYDGSGSPNGFASIQQDFDHPYDDLPHNGWGQAATLPSDCKS